MEMFEQSFGGNGKLKALKVRTSDGSLIDFEELVFMTNFPVAIPK